MSAAWWDMRRATNRKPATYTCPLCNKRLLAMTEHALITPEGDASRRRHAHLDCVARARAAGRLPTRASGSGRSAAPASRSWRSCVASCGAASPLMRIRLTQAARLSAVIWS